MSLLGVHKIERRREAVCVSELQEKLDIEAEVEEEEEEDISFALFLLTTMVMTGEQSISS